MAFIEIQKRKGKEYYYLAKSIRVGKNKWEKKRLYLGNRKLAHEVIRQKLLALEKQIKKFNSYELLEEKNVELLEDLKIGFEEWRKETPESLQEKTNENFIVRYTYNTNAIEGNRLTLRQTALALLDKVIPTGASAKDYQEAVNGKKSLEFIKQYKGDFDHKLLLKLHETITKDTGLFYSGRIRPIDVSITGSDHAPPKAETLAKHLGDLYKWYQKNKKSLHPFELAVMIHAKLAWIHPFEDGNGRTARAVMNFILLKNRYPMFFIPNEKKEKYYTALEYSDKKDYKKYVNQVVDLVKDQIKEYGKIKDKE